MTPAERAQILLTARLLEAARSVDVLSMGLTLIAALALVFRVPSLAGCAAIVLGLVARYYAMRIAFDARLFNDIAHERISAGDLDAAFPGKAGRSVYRWRPPLHFDGDMVDTLVDRFWCL